MIFYCRLVNMGFLHATSNAYLGDPLAEGAEMITVEDDPKVLTIESLIAKLVAENRSESIMVLSLSKN